MKKILLLTSGLFLTAFVVVAAAIWLVQPDALYQFQINQFTQREIAYNSLIAEANQRIADLQSKPEISAQAAIAIAVQASGGILPNQDKPQLVNYAGQLAYEVVFTEGNLYISAQNGLILAATLLIPVSPQKALEAASRYVGRNDAVRAERLLSNGIEYYRVLFNNGTIVFTDLNGTVVSVQFPSRNPIITSGQNTQSDDHEDDD